MMDAVVTVILLLSHVCQRFLGLQDPTVTPWIDYHIHVYIRLEDSNEKG